MKPFAFGIKNAGRLRSDLMQPGSGISSFRHHCRSWNPDPPRDET